MGKRLRHFCSNEGLVFVCPSCKSPLSPDFNTVSVACLSCGCEFPVIEGVPLLVKDRSSIEQTIEDAKKAGREEWYKAPQMSQWEGPYRHHVRKRKQYVEAVLKSYIEEHHEKLTGLDLGCGDGGNLLWLTPYFHELYASDYNLLRLERAAAVPGVRRVFMADVTNYPTSNNVFDVIFFNHVLEHIPDDDKALREVFRILKPGGLLILGVPNEGVFFWQLAYKLQPKMLATSDHVHFYTSDSIRERCQRAGFVVREIHPIGWGLPHWWLDAAVRGWKWTDDLFEKMGRNFLPSQATSLYLILSK